MDAASTGTDGAVSIAVDNELHWPPVRLAMMTLRLQMLISAYHA